MICFLKPFGIKISKNCILFGLLTEALIKMKMLKIDAHLIKDKILEVLEHIKIFLFDSRVTNFIIS